MNFRATFCEPSQPDIIDLGIINRDAIIPKFESIPWVAYLQEMKDKRDEEIYFSPSFEVENRDNNHALSISAVGEPDDFEFYIFYKRPKMIKTMFGLSQKIADDYMTDIAAQTKEDAIACIRALIANDLEYLDKKII